MAGNTGLCRVGLVSELNKAKSHVDKILSNLPHLISSATVSSYQLMQLVAINLYALFHSHRRSSGSLATETVASINDISHAHQNGDIGAQVENNGGARSTNFAQHVLYDKLMFSFTGMGKLIVFAVLFASVHVACWLSG